MSVWIAPLPAGGNPQPISWLDDASFVLLAWQPTFLARPRLSLLCCIATRRGAVRIAIIDESPARAAVIQEGLIGSGLTDIIVLTERTGLVARIEALSPDVVLIDLANPQRDELEELFAVSRAIARPIAMFVDRADDSSIEAAIDAGVSAYVVDGLRPERIKSVLDVAIKRFNAFSRLRAELDEARGALAERNVLDLAKAILMKKRGLDEPAAYALLRKAAMDSGRKIADVAEALVTAEKLLGGL
jgi:two-component system, response regulator / RNA-binding antiterminator